MSTVAEKKSQQERNKSLIRSFIREIFSEHNLSSIEKYFDKESVKGIPEVGIGSEGFKQFLINFFTAFPDWHTTIERMLARSRISYRGRNTQR